MEIPSIEFIAIGIAAILFILSACIYCWYKIEESRDVALVQQLKSRIKRGRAANSAAGKKATDRSGSYAQIATNDEVKFDDDINDGTGVTDSKKFKPYYDDDDKIDEREFEDGDIEFA